MNLPAKFLTSLIFIVVSLTNPNFEPWMPSANSAAEPKPGSGGDWAKAVSAAKKEGRLSGFLYQRENIESAVKAFEKKFPEIQVTTASTPAAETGPRIMAERRAAKYLWDICICGPTTPYAVLYPAKALDPIKPVLQLPEVLDGSKWWVEIITTWIPKGTPSSFSWAASRCPTCITTRTRSNRKN
jgi:ABC-type glycerol-3-phosphate transport system substrate-binding protein